MSSNFVEDQKQEFSDLLEKTGKLMSKKKPIKKVLSSYLKKQHIDENLMKKMKNELEDIKNNMKEAKTSFETLMHIQKKLSKIYNNLNENENEQKNTKKNN